MKAIISTFIAVICAASAVMAQDKPALTDVDSLAAKPSDYSGKIVAVSGIVERVSETKRMFTLIDASEAGCADGCQRAMIVAQLGPRRDNAAQSDRAGRGHRQSGHFRARSARHRNRTGLGQGSRGRAFETALGRVRNSDIGDLERVCTFRWRCRTCVRCRTDAFRRCAMARSTQSLGGESSFLGGAVCSRRRSGWRGFARVFDDNRAAGDSPETPRSG